MVLDHPDVVGSTAQHRSTTNGPKHTHGMMVLAGMPRESLDNLNTEDGLAESTLEKLVEFRAQQQ